jgi:transposase
MSQSQNKYLGRVEARLAEAIREYIIRPGQRFHLSELTEWVRNRVGECAPDSPARILRHLRNTGALNYRCVSRAQSLYEVTN